MVIARREPRDPVGWVLLAAGFLLILSTLGDARLYLHADYGLHHGTLPLGSVAILIGLAAVVQDRVRVVAAVLGLVLLVLVGSTGAFVVRQVLGYRRSTGDRRQQLEWVMCGAVITAGAVPLFIWHPGGSSLVVHVLGFVSAVGIAALPLSIGVAILYRSTG